ncbi:MAG: radical SAM protein [Deltaproteobacteria bacterium]|nr:radical SAM protein [Deltaproteobacteria bacterium]
MVRQEFLHTIRAGMEGNELSFKGILLLLSSKEREENELLWAAADWVRQNWVGDEIHLRGIVEFSNFCVQNCLYFGLRRDNHRLVRYRMSTAEIVQAAKKARSQGLQTIVLQSGEDPWFTRDRLSDLIRDIKEQTNLSITLAVGERRYADYYAWKKAGADRYLLKHETASTDLFKTLRAGHKLAKRLKALRWLQELEYEVGSGNMVGLPGQTDEDLAADIQLFRELDFDMIGIGPFIAHPQTPLAAAGDGELEKALKVLAIKCHDNRGDQEYDLNDQSQDWTGKWSQNSVSTGIRA